MAKNIIFLVLIVYADRATGDSYEKITNVATFNNQETVVNLEHKKGEVWLLIFRYSFLSNLKSQKKWLVIKKFLRKDKRNGVIK
jgi:hypothetical protein